MFCMPECRACVTAGTCPKGEVPAVPLSLPKPVTRKTRRRAAQHAAIEAGLSHYFYLTCGDITTRQEQEVFQCWAPKRGAYWCETCGTWNGKRKENKPEPLPAEPMF